MNTNLRKVSDLLGKLSGILIAVMALITVADVIGRTLFQRSIQGALEINLVLLVSVAFLGVAAAEWDKRHVEVSILEKWLHGGTEKVFNGVRTGFIVLIVGAMIFAAGQDALSSYTRGEFTGGVLGITVWPTKLLIVVSLTLYLLSVVAKWRLAPSGHETSNSSPDNSGVI